MKLSVRLVAVLSLAALSAPGCKLFKRMHPSGHLARTADPAQYTDEYPNQTSPQWDSAMNISSTRSHAFGARDTGKLHVWLRYGCVSRDGAFTLRGSLGYQITGTPPVAPVPVVATAEGATLSGLSRGDFSPIVVNAPRSSSEGGMGTDGYIYLFDIDVPEQRFVTLEGRLDTEQGARCSMTTLEVWRD